MKEKAYAAKQTRTIKVWFSQVGISVSVGVSKERGGDPHREAEAEEAHRQDVHCNLS